MFKIIKEMLPPDVRVARDAQDLLVECCVEFINLISSESNEVCSREEKRTIAPEHVLKALEVCLCYYLCIFFVSYFSNILILQYTCSVTVGCPQSVSANISNKEASKIGDGEFKGKDSAMQFMKCFSQSQGVLGFGEYIEEVYAAYEHHKLETLDSPKAGKWSTSAEMTEEEALAEQQRMFAEARARMNGTNFAKQSESDGN
ncbi:Dr1-like protein [Nymphaea thermarum]|nr:Dr1-like protein [Nymphaea thermarum]